MATATEPRQPLLSPWRMVVGLGLVSLTVDMVADGAKSIAGPYLAQLGASALVVGAVTGAAEAVGLAGRLATGPWVDRNRRYWGFTIAGYALTVVSVPLLAAAPLLGAGALAAAAALLVVERLGKAVRSPAKTALLADAAGAVGSGRGFAVHKTLDQVGAFAGPLVVAAVVAATGRSEPAFLALVVPGTAALLLLGRLRARVPDPARYRVAAAAARGEPGPNGGGLAAFLPFALFAALSTLGTVGFGVVSFHLDDAGLVPLPVVPLVYALGMLVAALAALVTGWLYDRRGPATLAAVPLLVVAIPPLVLADRLGLVLAGVAAWGACIGVQDSTVKAFVADTVPAARRGTAYGVFAVLQGAATFAAAALAGALYDDVARLTALVAAAQAAALVLLAVALRRLRSRRATPSSAA